VTSAPSDHQRLIDHNYDGIQEYDNPLPRWWVLGFWLTIIFSALYVLNIGVGVGEGRMADYEKDVAAWKAAHPDAEASSPEELAALVANPDAISQGKQLFTTQCASCHRADGGGLIGPNLTDHFWIHGATLPEIHKTINEGVLAKGMPPWGRVLKPDQINVLAAYVASIVGSNPQNPKAPEGTEVKPAGTEPKSDTTGAK
jgi:cytochrome c oxidase cbb3-type subunit 3